MYLDESDNKQWKWDVEDLLNSCMFYENSVDMIKDRMSQLPEEYRQVLTTASCFGMECVEETLQEAVVDCFVDRVLDHLQAKGFMEPVSESHWRFTHDQVQQSAYSLIPTGKHTQAHLDIGRQLWQELSDHSTNDDIFVVVNQLRRGVDLIQDEDERIRLSTLLLRAGELAASTSSFTLASSHLRLGIDLLNERHWRDHYYLSLSLYSAAAEVEYCIGNFARMDELINAVTANARTRSEETRVKSLSIYALGTQHRLKEAVSMACNVLKDLDYEIPQKWLMLTVIMELKKTKRMLRGMTDSGICALPLMNDPNAILALRVHAIVFPYALMSNPIIAVILSMKMVQITMKQGLSSVASVAFATFALFLSGPFKDIKFGTRLGLLSLEMLKMFQAKEYLPRVYICVHGVSFALVQPLQQQLQPLLYAHLLGLGSGDIENASLAAAFYSSMGLCASFSLSRLLYDMKTFIKMFRTYKQTTNLMLLSPTVQTVLNLMGYCENPLVLTGEVMAEDALFKEGSESGNDMLLSVLWNYKLMLASYFRDYDCAQKAIDELERCDKRNLSSFAAVARTFHTGLISVALFRKNKAGRMLRVTRKSLKTLAYYGKHCPANVMSKVRLIEAEMEVSKGRMDSAMVKYSEAMSLSSAEDLLSDYALACECAAASLVSCNRTSEAATYYTKAVDAYQIWGAKAKAEHVKSRMTELGLVTVE
jgi:predicted ATPase